VHEDILGSSSKLGQLRKDHSLDASELKKLLFLEDNYPKYIKPLYDFFESNKQIFTHHNIEGQTREEMREAAAKMSLAIMKFCKIDLINDPSRLIYSLWATSMFDGGIVTKTFLHYFLYCKSLVMLGSCPRHNELLADALALKDLGCFGLT
jgi:hypothetical protein